MPAAIKPSIRKKKMPPELQGWLLSLPALTLFVVFYIGPALMGLWISLFKCDGISSQMTFVALENYARLFGDARFWNSLRVNFIILGLSLFLLLPISIFVAVLLSKRQVGMNFFRNAIFLPQILSVATIALVWTLLYEPYRGFINNIPQFFGFERWGIAWLGDRNLALMSVIFVIFWSSLGFHVVLFLAGLSRIPEEIFDAVRLETNNPLHTLRYITIPLLRETIFISFVVIVGSSFGHKVGIVFLMTFGGPFNSTEMMALYSYLIAFKGHQFGYSSAISLVILLLVFAIVIVPTIRLARERLEY